jgi:4-amino-4-deoxy-L-arabinose transferase-like glycosyltransferase
VASLLIAHSAIAFTATLDASATFDEVLHIASGLSYWTTDDYRLQPENGNLPQRWCALPLVALGYRLPEDEVAWRQSDSFQLGRSLLYGSGHDPAVILSAARAMAAVWSAALCLVVYLWSRSLFGHGGGLVSLGLAAFWPALVAHGPLATSDACGSLFFTLGAWSLWNLVNRVTVGSLIAASVAVGLAAIAKHSCVLLAPLAGLFVIIMAASRRPLPLSMADFSTMFVDRGRKAAVMAASLVGPLLAAVFMIWASCGFRYRAFADEAALAEFFRFPTLADCVGYAGGVGMLCEHLANWQILPESWLWGMSQVVARAQSREAFAIGEHSMLGWWWFFPLCLAIKNTLPSLVLAGFGVTRAASLVVTRLARRLALDDEAWNVLPLLVWLVILWPTFLTCHLNIGERHLLPSYPPLMILAGGCWRAATVPWRKLLICGLVGLHAVDVASRYPSSLAYFNQFVPRGEEHRWLVDSSLDWGQDLDRLRRWSERHRNN